MNVFPAVIPTSSTKGLAFLAVLQMLACSTVFAQSNDLPRDVANYSTVGSAPHPKARSSNALIPLDRVGKGIKNGIAKVFGKSTRSPQTSNSNVSPDVPSPGEALTSISPPGTDVQQSRRGDSRGFSREPSYPTSTQPPMDPGGRPGSQNHPSPPAPVHSFAGSVDRSTGQPLAHPANEFDARAPSAEFRTASMPGVPLPVQSVPNTGSQHANTTHYSAPGGKYAGPSNRYPNAPPYSGIRLGNEHITATQHALQLQEENALLRGQQDVLQREVSRLREQLSASQNLVTKMQTAISDASDELRMLDVENQTLRSKISSLENENARQKLEARRMMTSIQQELDDILVREINAN